MVTSVVPSHLAFTFDTVISKIIQLLPWYDMSKACTKCRVEQPLSAFGKHKSTRDGYACWCKACQSEHGREYRKTASGIYTNILGRSKHYHKTGRKVSKPVHISREDFITWHKSEPKFCAYCDISEDDVLLLPEHYKMQRERLSVDCKDNLLGYEIDNIVLACGRCNFIKGDTFSYGEMRRLAQVFIKPKWKRLKIEKDDKNGE